MQRKKRGKITQHPKLVSLIPDIDILALIFENEMKIFQGKFFSCFFFSNKNRDIFEVTEYYSKYAIFQWYRSPVLKSFDQFLFIL